MSFPRALHKALVTGAVVNGVVQGTTVKAGVDIMAVNGATGSAVKIFTCGDSRIFSVSIGNERGSGRLQMTNNVTNYR